MLPLRADRVHTHGGGAGETQPRSARPRVQRQVRPAQGRQQVSRAGSDTHAVDDVERDRAHSRNRHGANVVEIVDPVEPGPLRGRDETLGGSGHFMRAADPDGAAVAMGRAAEIQVGLDGAEAVQDIGPGPAGQRQAIEVARQSAAEVAAVDRARTADRRPAHDRMPAHGSIGQTGLIAPHQWTVDPDRQLQPVGGLSEQSRIVESRPRLEDGHRAARIGGKTFGNNRSSTAGTDDQHIAVRGGRGQGGG